MLSCFHLLVIVSPHTHTHTHTCTNTLHAHTNACPNTLHAHTHAHTHVYTHTTCTHTYTHTHKSPRVTEYLSVCRWWSESVLHYKKKQCNNCLWGMHYNSTSKHKGPTYITLGKITTRLSLPWYKFVGLHLKILDQLCFPPPPTPLG